MTPDADLLVIGGGPVGLAVAIEGRLAGLSVIVVEPRATPVDKACGEGLMPGAVAALARLGVDPEGHTLTGIRYLRGARTADHLFAESPGRGVRRTVLHAALAARARELGAVVVPGRAGAVEQDAVVRLVRGAPGALAPGLRRPALDGPPPGRPLDAPPPARPAVRGAPPLPGGAVDRPRRGALGALRRGVRDARWPTTSSASRSWARPTTTTTGRSTRSPRCAATSATPSGSAPPRGAGPLLPAEPAPHRGAGAPGRRRVGLRRRPDRRGRAGRARAGARRRRDAGRRTSTAPTRPTRRRGPRPPATTGC